MTPPIAPLVPAWVQAHWVRSVVDDLIRNRIAAVASAPDDRVLLTEAMSKLRERIAGRLFAGRSPKCTDSGHVGACEVSEMPRDM